MAQKYELSENARELIQKNNELRRKTSKYVKVLDKETRIFRFFPDETESYESEKFGNLRFAYTVIEVGNDEKQIWEVSKTTSEDIDNLLVEGYLVLKVRRIGSDKRTIYEIGPAD